MLSTTWSCSAFSLHYNNLLSCPSCTSIFEVFCYSFMGIFNEWGNSCARCCLSYVVLFAIDMVIQGFAFFFFSSQNTGMLWHFVFVYNLTICIMKRHCNPDIIHLLKQVCVLFPWVKHVSSFFSGHRWHMKINLKSQLDRNIKNLALYGTHTGIHTQMAPRNHPIPNISLAFSALKVWALRMIQNSIVSLLRKCLGNA